MDLASTYPIPLLGGELLLVRHGESTANARGIGQGRAEYPLSERGLAQARLTGEHLAKLGGIEAVYSSPQQRAAQTAEAIATALNLPVEHDPDLVEIDIGVLSGLSWDQLRAQHPEVMAAYDAAERDTPHPRNRELIPGWEPIASTVERAWRAISRIVIAHPTGRVVVVAHGGVLNAFVTEALTRQALEAPWRYPHANCAITHLVLSAPRATIACVADDAHLAELATGRTVFDPPKDPAP